MSFFPQGPTIPGDVTYASGAFGDLVVNKSVMLGHNVNLTGPNSVSTFKGTVVIGDDHLLSKVGFFGKLPIVQKNVGNSANLTHVTVGGAAVTSDDKFGGYTIGQVVDVLQSYGMLA
jgi:hypothetical protein